MALSGSTGGSLGGKMIRVKREAFEKNHGLCTTCYSVKGEPCRAVKPGGKGFLHKTHRSAPEPNWSKIKRRIAAQDKRDEAKTPRSANPGFVPRNQRPKKNGGQRSLTRDDQKDS